MSSSSWPRLLVLEQAGFLPCDPWNGYLGIDPLTVGNLTLSDLAFGSKFPHCPDGIFSHILYHFIYNFLATKSEKTKKVVKNPTGNSENWLVIGWFFRVPCWLCCFGWLEVLPEASDTSEAAQLARAELDDAGLMLDQWGGLPGMFGDGCPEAVF